ncbi:MAG: (Fe-S)-binding protein [Solidesulfovibrio sp.]|uniref:(Fe-S)-binding protein n=1 Tax=Solidesulfovibrio sp. TaxID=2910990 RepID=UPI002B20A481|nr:(Fe-S)-binding protein [Solidesulfovibrio sp.]MEA4857593.1 (Fe-S)-binding protein [Solidesulfovibrio sp.]
MNEHHAQLKGEIIDILKYCINCRFCLPSCPRFQITSKEVSQGASGITRSLFYAAKWDEQDKDVLNELRDIVYKCTTCGSCEVACKTLSTGTKLVDAIEKGRELLIDMQIGPMPQQKKVLESLYNNGNPYMVTAKKRKEIVKGLNLKSYAEPAEFLLYLGCSSAIEEDVQKTAVALGKILDKANVAYGVLEDESCCGEPALKMGESALFEEMYTRNLDLFQRHGVKSIVTLSPHCYDTFLKKYPQDQMHSVKVQHYTAMLADLVKAKRLDFGGKLEKKVIYHDPCYLSKSNNITNEPRQVLSSVPGVALLEFGDNRVNSLCCGGGGGRMWADFDSEVNRLANIRVGEALDKKADVLVTACPWCFINMRDGAKVANAEGSLEVLSLAEFCAQAL